MKISNNYNNMKYEKANVYHSLSLFYYKNIESLEGHFLIFHSVGHGYIDDCFSDLDSFGFNLFRNRS